MNEQVPENPPEDADPTGEELGQEFGEPVRTGVEEVDAVLESVEDLEGRPVDEHVAVFENAHDQLRRALDGRSDA